ncbi:hypothetical protein EDF52_10281 [Curtobacterium sp. PhB42]|uniref:hypothetical protein n=1 Tax=unclassified Curtobacterium TaxID=257496 RepID=UPI001062C3FE|nr:MULTISPECIES: hypothetical protein [unclassified Curtobacterium]TDW50993.1 hypothetical protein EDF52_10281 [Curtobacterium sp. PhB42]TDW56161.1 hypothetical protein EDF47_104272 [Curtobacterium sp. PhB190]
MTEIVIDAGTLVASEEERTVTGLLVPYGEDCRSNLGRFSVEPGAFKIPDPSVVGFNVEHAREDSVGRATALRDTPEGVVATFSVAPGEDGDAALADIRSGRRKHLSAEVANVVIKAGKAVGGRLFGGALVQTPAFPSATLLAAAADTEVEPVQPDDPKAETETKTVTNADGSQTVTVTSTLTETAADGTTTVTKSVTTETIAKPEEQPAPEDQPKEEAIVPTATAPSTLQASAPKVEETGARSVFDAIRNARVGRASTDQETLLAALSDIKTSGTGALPADGVIQPAWLGEIWSARAYERKFWTLVKNGPLTNQAEKGFTVDQGTALVQKYSGNKAQVPSGTGSTSIVDSVFQRWAVAVDIAREFYDIPGNQEVIEAFVKGFFNSYAKETDRWALEQFLTAAGTQVDADTFPTTYNTSIGKVLQVLDVINDSDTDATSIVVARDVFKELMYTPKDLIPEYISLSFGTKGEGTGDGVTILRDKFDVLGEGQVLGLASEAAHLNELAGGSPLTVDALDIARGGIDKGVHGYTQFMAEYPDGIVLVGDKASA